MKRTTVFLTEPQIDALRREASRLDLKEAELIRRALDLFLESNPTPREKSGRKKES